MAFILGSHPGLLTAQKHCTVQHQRPNLQGFTRQHAVRAHRPQRPLRRSTALAAGAVSHSAAAAAAALGLGK